MDTKERFAGAAERAEAEVSRRMPMSSSQERFFFHEQLESLQGTYNVSVSLKLSGRLNVAALLASFDALVARHESLRTCLQLENGQGVQLVLRDSRCQLDVRDLSDVRPVEQEPLIETLRRETAWQPFRLETGPLFRVRLIRQSPTEHTLVIAAHHAVADAWSLSGVLPRELQFFYRAFCRGEAFSLPALKWQYGDYALWQREQLCDEGFKGRLRYWKERLSGVAALDLPSDRPRPAVPSFRGALHFFTVSPEISATLKALGRKEGVTLFNVTLAALQAVLGRWSNQEDVAICTLTAGRQHRYTLDLIGSFVDLLVLRVDLSGDPSFRELLRRMRETTLGAYAHQGVPFERIVAEVQPGRDPARQPLADVAFVLHNYERRAFELDGLDVGAIPYERNLAHRDLSWSLTETAGGLEGVAEYATDLFDAGTIERLVQSYQLVLWAVAQDAQRRLSELPVMSERQRQQVLVDLNATQRPLAPKCVHELFCAQAARTPDAIALICEEGSLSYRELDARTNQLAHALQAQGVGAEQPVAVCVERSVEMVVGLLGVLKAGGAYVPLDPTHPPQRLSMMLAECRAAWVLTQERFEDRLCGVRARIMALDSAWSRITQYPCEEPPRTDVDPSHLAYVIYTSGSTGVPKGAMNEHAAVVNRLQWMQQQYGLQAQDRVLQKTPYTFDVSVWEFFWPLLNGATLVLARPEGHRDPQYLRALIEQQQITRVHFVPSMLRSFLEGHEADRCPSLRQIVCSGEELTAQLQAACLQKIPQARLSNLYGPTEAAIDVTYWECKPEGGNARIPIGRPIANTQMYVLDWHGEPVPMGVRGEIYIGGVGVGRGYQGRAALTAERFIADGLSGRCGARLYRTGDLGRWRADGVLEYLGRNDSQVKLRGLRIELGEIEAALLRQPSVKVAAVLLKEERLVAYFSGELDQQALREQLPQYMLPGLFVPLEQLPLNSSGKLDRKALHDRDVTAQSQTEYVAPRTPLEESLATIWSEVLQRDRIGIHDNFFEAGGDSLRLIRVVHQFNLMTGQNVSVMDIFKYPSIAELSASRSTNHGLRTSQREIEPIAPAKRRRRARRAVANMNPVRPEPLT